MKIVINSDTLSVLRANAVPEIDSALQFFQIPDEDWKDYCRVQSEWAKWQDRLLALDSFEL